MVLSCKRKSELTNVGAHMKSLFDAWYKKEEANYDPGVLKSYGLDGGFVPSWLEFAAKKGISEKDAFAFWEEISGFKKAMSEKELLEFRQMRP